MLNKKVVILGGGLAGLTCAIHLLKAGHPVTLLEKNKYPNHKVCGEFISNEVRSYLTSLGIQVNTLGATDISEFSISSSSGRLVSSTLPLGGFGISRFTLDYALLDSALKLGCTFLQDVAENIEFKNNEFQIETQENGLIDAHLVIGAFGKRSVLDQKLGRSFFSKKSHWLAVKAHYRGNIEDNKVVLHNFEGGYCGISRVENDLINVCYLSDYTQFKAFKNIEEFQTEVLCKNPLLKAFFDNAQMVFKQPITISQISFTKKLPVEQHILMIGDTAGLIHPLCGNGMAMAIHSAKLCAELCDQYLKNEIEDRKHLEQAYASIWKATFQKRLFMGRMLAAILRKGNLLDYMLGLLAKFPFLLPMIIKRTHGKANI